MFSSKLIQSSETENFRSVDGRLISYAWGQCLDNRPFSDAIIDFNLIVLFMINIPNGLWHHTGSLDKR